MEKIPITEISGLNFDVGASEAGDILWGISSSLGNMFFVVMIRSHIYLITVFPVPSAYFAVTLSMAISIRLYGNVSICVPLQRLLEHTPIKALVWDMIFILNAEQAK